MGTYYTKVKVDITLQSTKPLTEDEKSNIKSTMYDNITHLRDNGMIGDEAYTEENELHTKMFSVEVE